MLDDASRIDGENGEFGNGRPILADESPENHEAIDSVDTGEAKQAVSFITRIRRFLGIGGNAASDAAGRVGGSAINTGISALDVDVANGVANHGVRANLDRCLAAYQCFSPEDQIAVRGFLGESPPNYRGVGELFRRREWDYRSYSDLLTE